MITLLVLSVLAGVPAFDALLPEESTFRTEGATVRLVAETPNGNGRVRGAVLFDLEPGWKTYWIDPGEAGLAPMLRFTVGGAEAPAAVQFPAPIRFAEGGVPVNGYDEPFAIAFTLEAAAVGTLELELRAGLCLDLCVPVSARLATDLSEPASAGDIAAVERAFLSLPEDRSATAVAIIEGDEIVVEAPDGREGSHDLFIESPRGWSFGPARNEGSGWRVPIRMRPAGSSDARLPLTGVLADRGRGEAIRVELP